MTWHACKTCEPPANVQKTTNYHEATEHRQFRITIHKQCGRSTNRTESVNFYVNFPEIASICADFQKFKKHNHLEITTNCTSSRITAPVELAVASSDPCSHAFTAPLNPTHFHAFLESACSSVQGEKPVRVTATNIVPILDVLAHFNSDELLRRCRDELKYMDIESFEPSLLVQLLHKGLSVNLDHRVLARILCVCLANVSKMTDVSEELTGPVGAVFAQALVADSAKQFSHLLSPPGVISNGMPFVCQCGQHIGKREKETFCYPAVDKFLFKIRRQLYPHTIRDPSDTICITVIDRDDKKPRFRLKLGTPIRALKEAYYAKPGVPVGDKSFRFPFRLVSDEETPITLFMMDGDIIFECRNPNYALKRRRQDRHLLYSENLKGLRRTRVESDYESENESDRDTASRNDATAKKKTTMTRSPGNTSKTADIGNVRKDANPIDAQLGGQSDAPDENPSSNKRKRTQSSTEPTRTPTCATTPATVCNKTLAAQTEHGLSELMARIETVVCSFGSQEMRERFEMLQETVDVAKKLLR